MPSHITSQHFKPETSARPSQTRRSTDNMAATATVRIFDQTELHALKHALARQLETQKHVRKLTCVACTHRKGRNLTRTFEGRAEYLKTGICEECWSALMQDDQKQKAATCNKLTVTGAALLRLTIYVHKARLQISMPDAPARVCEQIIANTFDTSTMYGHAYKPRRANARSSTNAAPPLTCRRAQSSGPRTPH